MSADHGTNITLGVAFLHALLTYDPRCSMHSVFSYYPMKMGDHVSIGANTVLEASNNRVARRDWSQLSDWTLRHHQRLRAHPGRERGGAKYGDPFVFDLWRKPGEAGGRAAETFSESCEAKMKDFYQRFRAHQR